MKMSVILFVLFTMTALGTASFPSSSPNQDLTAYWEIGYDGPFGDDHNKNWCNPSGGWINGAVCPSERSVDTSVCSSGTAYLWYSVQAPRSNYVWGDFPEINGVSYYYYSEWGCTVSPPPSTEAPQSQTFSSTPNTDLIAYRDRGTCGPVSDDHNIDWCSVDSNGYSCPSTKAVSSVVCSSGIAYLVASISRPRSNSVWGDFPNINGCDYFYYSEWSCNPGCTSLDCGFFQNHGTCQDNVCVCKHPWSGSNCDVKSSCDE